MVLENVTGNYNMIQGAGMIGTGPLYYALIIALTIGLVVAAFYLIKYFRWFVYGLAGIIPTIIAWFISKASVDTYVATGDSSQIWWIIGTVVGIPCSIILGYFLSKLKIVKQWENKISVNEEITRKKK